MKIGEYTITPGADLRGAYLRGADLRGADLSHADLSDANLSHADLRGADLSHADLRGADLRGANLRGTNLSDANLSDANLKGANLRGANLSDAYGLLLLPVQDHRGYSFCHAIHCGQEWRVRVGCRDYSIAEAREHWGRSYVGDRLQGDMYLYAIDWLERKIKAI